MFCQYGLLSSPSCCSLCNVDPVPFQIVLVLACSSVNRDRKGKWSIAQTSLICVVCVCELPLLAVPTGNHGKSFGGVPRANAVLGTYTHPLGISSPIGGSSVSYKSIKR
ncbi:hypothetical protein JTE90_004866 [Oedothorax gibbosus]|uniref:Uncharacterized protein n=1 Tax=Oedothorax gibbosus TaxID=931172 RepID=A0AAV6US86_9ARAC|nr:hypothetical protein JTE90_004866 [Oedothorax gibbosus]